MISFQVLGKHGRLGNQLFQYAFLKTTARRLGTKFYCPRWTGDEIFELDDKSERVEVPNGIIRRYTQSIYNVGLSRKDLKIKNGTDIVGFFQTDKYFDPVEIRKWYTFREERFEALRKKYADIDFQQSVGYHLRFGDNLEDCQKFVNFYLIPSRYYFEAILRVRRTRQVLIFSDNPQLAREQLKNFRRNLIFVEGNQDYEDLYLMSHCHDFACSLSTLSWWGAWLIPYPDKVVVVPKEGVVRPGRLIRNADFWPDEWIQIRTLNPIFENFPVAWLLQKIGLYTPKRTLRRFCLETPKA